LDVKYKKKEALAELIKEETLSPTKSIYSPTKTSTQSPTPTSNQTEIPKKEEITVKQEEIKVEVEKQPQQQETVKVQEEVKVQVQQETIKEEIKVQVEQQPQQQETVKVQVEQQTQEINKQEGSEGDQDVGTKTKKTKNVELKGSFMDHILTNSTKSAPPKQNEKERENSKPSWMSDIKKKKRKKILKEIKLQKHLNG